MAADTRERLEMVRLSFTQRERRLTSFRPTRAKVKALIEKQAATMHGKKYGYILQNSAPWKVDQRSAGREKTPPMIGLESVHDSQRSTCYVDNT